MNLLYLTCVMSLEVSMLRVRVGNEIGIGHDHLFTLQCARGMCLPDT